MCVPPTEGIDLLTLINLPDFYAHVRNILNVNKPMKINDAQLQDLIAKQHMVELALPQFVIARRAVVHFMQTEVLKNDF